MHTIVSRIFIVFHVLALLYALLFTLSPLVFLVFSPLLGLISCRLLYASWYGLNGYVVKEILKDISKGWYSWGILSVIALYCGVNNPDALVMRSLSVEVLDNIWMEHSLFKPISLVVFIGVLQLEVLAPRSLVSSYWEAFRKQPLPFNEWIKQWNAKFPQECVAGGMYVVLLYIVSILCPILTFAAVCLLFHYYTATMELS